MNTNEIYNETHLQGSVDKEIEALEKLLNTDINLWDRVWASSRISQLRTFGRIGPKG